MPYLSWIVVACVVIWIVSLIPLLWIYPYLPPRNSFLLGIGILWLLDGMTLVALALKGWWQLWTLFFAPKHL
jgi:hypothetical protein